MIGHRGGSGSSSSSRRCRSANNGSCGFAKADLKAVSDTPFSYEISWAWNSESVLQVVVPQRLSVRAK